MKRTAMAFTCFALVSMTIKAQFGQIVLQHNGAVSIYENSQMDDAMDKAVDGDTIFLSEGNFSGDMNITKKLSIIGAGVNTYWSNNVNIDIPNSPTLTARLLDAFTISGNITVKQPCKGVNIRQCTFKSISFDALTENATIDRCYCKGDFIQSTNVHTMSVLNSKIYQLSKNAYTSADALFMNCNIYYINNNNSGNSIGGTFTNCIIRRWNYTSGYYYYNSIVFLNCLGGENWSMGNINNCWNYGNTNILDSSCNCSQSDETLMSKGYIGTDGTVVGITGGAAPFTLTPNVPRVTEHTIIVDTDKKELNVNIKVTTN